MGRSREMVPSFVTNRFYNLRQRVPSTNAIFLLVGTFIFVLYWVTGYVSGLYKTELLCALAGPAPPPN